MQHDIEVSDPSPDTLLRASQRFLAALNVLIGHPGGFGVAPIGLLASHSLEVGLKAYLLTVGWTQKEIRTIGHDLVRAWTAAVSARLPLESDVPSWVKTLDLHHDRPFMYRYTPEGVGVGIPAPPDLSRLLAQTIEILVAAMPSEAGLDR